MRICILEKKGKQGIIKKVTLVPEEGMETSLVDRRVQDGNRNFKHKGPEVDKCLECLRKSKKISAPREDQMRLERQLIGGEGKLWTGNHWKVSKIDTA